MLKFDEMDFGTKLRTVLVIVSSLNTALMATDLTGFNNPTVNLIYKIVSLIFNFVIVALTAYFNQDFTAEGMQGTNVTRMLKADPTMVVELRDGDEDDEDEGEPSIAEVGEETIEEGETNEVE